MQELTKEQQELMDKAIKNYPICAEVISTQKTKGIIDKSDFYFNHYGDIYANGGDLEIYFHAERQWAEILSLPQSEGREEKPMFYDAENGDRVWDLLLGEGEIVSSLKGCWIRVKFENSQIQEYALTGCLIGSLIQTLYWSKPEIIAPPRPKRMVTKEVDCWVLTDHIKDLYPFYCPSITLKEPTQPEYYTKATLTYKTEE